MYTHAPLNYNCPFCLIQNHQFEKGSLSAETDLVYHDALTTAFIGVHQLQDNPGNTIVIPNQHIENLYSLPDELARPLHQLVKAIALAMKQGYKCDGVSTRQHNEPAGNQDVWHYHIHVTPRYQDDNFYSSYKTGAHLMPVDARAKLAEKLRPLVSSIMDAGI